MSKLKSIYDIDVTRTLLDKPESELSDLEKEAVKHFNEQRATYMAKLDKANEQIQEDCKILCSGRFSEKCIIPEYGWIEPVKKAAYKLEKLNYFYKKWNMHVIFSQTKEKFGTFRGYWTIVNERSFPCASLLNKLNEHLMYNVDYGKKYVVDKCAMTTLEWEECSEEDYNDHLDRYGSRVKKFKEYDESKLIGSAIYLEGTSYPRDTTYFRRDEDNKKFYRSYWLSHPAKGHYEVTKHKLINKLQTWLNSIIINMSYDASENTEHHVMYENFYNEVSEIVAVCEEECGHYCQICGNSIGDHRIHDKCETSGWITYICDRCAIADGGKYFNHNTGKLMQELKEIKKKDSSKTNQIKHL